MMRVSLSLVQAHLPSDSVAFYFDRDKATVERESQEFVRKWKWATGIITVLALTAIGVGLHWIIKHGMDPSYLSVVALSVVTGFYILFVIFAVRQVRGHLDSLKPTEALLKETLENYLETSDNHGAALDLLEKVELDTFYRDSLEMIRSPDALTPAKEKMVALLCHERLLAKIAPQARAEFIQALFIHQKCHKQLHHVSDADFEELLSSMKSMQEGVKNEVKKGMVLSSCARLVRTSPCYAVLFLNSVKDRGVDSAAIVRTLPRDDLHLGRLVDELAFFEFRFADGLLIDLEMWRDQPQHMASKYIDRGADLTGILKKLDVDRVKFIRAIDSHKYPDTKSFLQQLMGLYASGEIPVSAAELQALAACNADFLVSAFTTHLPLSSLLPQLQPHMDAAAFAVLSERVSGPQRQIAAQTLQMQPQVLPLPPRRVSPPLNVGQTGGEHDPIATPAPAEPPRAAELPNVPLAVPRVSPRGVEGSTPVIKKIDVKNP